MALTRAVVDEKAVPDYGLLPDRRKVIVRRDTLVTTRILPVSDSVRFVILSGEQIRAFADRYGHFVYVTVDVRPVAGDSGVAGVSTTWAGSKRQPRMIYLSGGGCAWQYRKREGVWRFEKTLGCLIS